MPISTYADYNERMYRLNSQQISKTLVSTATGSKLSSGWLQGVDAGVAPTASVVPNNTTNGALNKESVIGATGYTHVIARTSLNASTGTTKPAVADRLSHQGGLNATLTTTQTTNLPTAALTRYTSGEGVMAAIEIYTSIGGTSTTVTVSYTNQAGVSGRTSQPILIGASGYNVAGKLLPIMPQDGDTGFRSVESVTLLATTGTIGNFGIVLFKPIFCNHPVVAGIEQYGTNTFNNLIGGGVQFETVQEGACLFMIGGGNGNIVSSGVIQFMEIS